MYVDIRRDIRRSGHTSSLVPSPGEVRFKFRCSAKGDGFAQTSYGGRGVNSFSIRMAAPMTERAAPTACSPPGPVVESGQRGRVVRCLARDVPVAEGVQHPILMTLRRKFPPMRTELRDELWGEENVPQAGGRLQRDALRRYAPVGS